MAARRAPSTPHRDTTGWLYVGAVVFDLHLSRQGRVVDIGYPADDERQAVRAWLRPVGGGREWNPLIEDLGPDGPETTGDHHAD